MAKENNLVRVLCLVKSEVLEYVSVLEQLMCEQFPSIWLEFKDHLGAKTIIGGFYREWTREGIIMSSLTLCLYFVVMMMIGVILFKSNKLWLLCLFKGVCFAQRSARQSHLLLSRVVNIKHLTGNT